MSEPSHKPAKQPATARHGTAKQPAALRERDLEAERIANSFRPQWRPLALTVGLNLLLAGLLLGVPYWRGHQLARTQKRDFARFAHCFFGGSIPTKPGFGLPTGDSDHFAQNMLHATPDWPMRCRRPLQSLKPPHATFLWPSVKQAGADLRAVVDLVDRELTALQRMRSMGHARVPTRPLAAVAKLQAALTLMAQAAGTDKDLDNDVVRFDAGPSLPTPARLPLIAAPGALLSLTSTAGALEALAVDGRGVSWLRMDAGKIDRERVKRSGLVRALLRDGDQPFVVWATAEARCREREDRCAYRATGVAAYAKGGGALPAPTWLAGHPAARADRVMRVSAGRAVDLVVRSGPGPGLALRRFTLPESARPADAPPLAAVDEREVAAGSTAPESAQSATDADAVLLPGNPSAVAYAASSAGAVAAHLVSMDSARAPLAFEPVPGDGPWVSACSSASASFVAYGSRSAYRVARIDPKGATQLSPLLARSVSKAFDDENPALDHVRLLCGAGSARVLILDASAALWLSVCPADADCSAARKLADHVSSFAALALEQSTVVAYAGVGDANELRVLRTSDSGEALAPALVPAACWEPFGGMCGVPTLIQDGPRLVLAAREGDDLLVLESNDAGAHFETLSGFKVGTAFDPVSHDPLQQHRVRKGLN